MITMSLPDGSRATLTDSGNAQWFAFQHKSDLRWVVEWGSWLVWDGTRWQRAKDIAAIDRARVTARYLHQLAANEADDEKRKQLSAHALRSEGASRIEAMVKLARSDLQVSASDLDKEPLVLNVANGTLDLRTGALRPHAREDLITRLAPVKYDAAVTCPLWNGFLARVLPNPDVQGWVQRLAGYAATGFATERVLAFFCGGGANGKSTFLEVVLAVLGEYAVAAMPDLLLASTGERHPTEIVDLRGARLAVCQEVEVGRRWNESSIKRMTGNDTMTARRLYEDSTSWAPTHTIVIAANHRPRVRGQDPAIWDRIRLIPWDVRIPEAEQDRTLRPRIIADEASGVLRWIVDGALAWQSDGLRSVPAIAAATSEYRHDQDDLAPFLEDACTVVADGFAPRTDLHRAYRSWAIASGLEHPWSSTALYDALEERGLRPAKRHGVRGFVGISLRASGVRSVA